MPSNAYRDDLLVLLADAGELLRAHERLRTRRAGRQWRLGSLNRAVVVISVSAWEAYVESLVLEVVNVIQPAAPPLQHWQSLNALVRGDVGRFNTPNTANVTNLFNRAFGLADVSVGWNWQNTTFQEARDRLEAALNCRHEIAHGVNPRPQVHNTYAARLSTRSGILSCKDTVR